jgi:peptide/nickel transport system substrate-binding protein
MWTRYIGVLLLITGLLFTACGPGASSPTTPGSGRGTSSPATEGPKTIVIGVTSAVTALPIMGSSTTAGGWQSLNELYAQGLVTADHTVRQPIPRLATAVPSLDDGSIEILPDGRMKTVYRLRHDVTWQDGEPFTAQDLVFSYQVSTDRNLPRLNVDAISQMDSVEATDDSTFVIYFKGPYYQADSIGLRALWPLPRHLLEEGYTTLDPQAFINLPYWTTEYVHLGPFRLSEFRAGEQLTFDAYPGYFLGAPKLSRVIVKVFNDENVLYAGVLSGSVDMMMDNSLPADLAFQLKEQWDANGTGTVHVGTGTTRFLAAQFDPNLQSQPAVLDPRVRQALYLAVDRHAVSDVVNRGHGELVANSLLPPGDRLYNAVQDGLARFSFDPGRARDLLQQTGWQFPDAGGILVGTGGQRLTTELWTTEGADNEIAVIADYWKQVGVSTEQYVVPGSLVRDRQYRQTYPGFETSARGSGDAILTRFDPRESAAPPNYSGSNRGHYANPDFAPLIDRYRQSVQAAERAQVIKAISDLVAQDLPVMPLYFDPTTPGVRKGVVALDDFAGGAEAAQLYGTFSRNAHEWEVR